METVLFQKMELFTQLISCGQNLSYWELDSSLQLIRSTSPQPELFHAFFLMDNCRDTLLDHARRGQVQPMVFTNSLGLSWIATVELAEGKLCRVYLIGPAFLSDVSYLALEKALYEKRHPKDFIEQFMSHIRELPIVGLDLWIRYGLMLHFCVTGEKLGVSDLCYIDLSPCKQEKCPANDAPYPKDGTWYAEQMAMKMVEEGRIDYVKARSDLSTIAGANVLGSNPTLRQFKNYVISHNALVVRAAIRGGLDPSTAYHLGEVYQESIEASTSVSALAQVGHTMFEDFVHRVHKRRTAVGISSVVQSVCSYIELHLGEKLNMQTLAAQVGYADYYLAHKFKKEMGMTVSQYIRQQRVVQAKLMLRSSNQSIASIADSLGFCNSSHFSDAFRSLTGMTPVEYREKGT